MGVAGMGINVAVFGAFDVNSYGDSLFPCALEIELKKRIEIEKIVLFTPTENKAKYNETKQVYSYSKFEDIHKQYKFDVIVIGGGELLHNRTIEFQTEDKRTVVYNKGEIWKKPLEYAHKYGIKVLFNSVGMPDTVNEEDKNLLETVQYLSVRDVYSAMRLCGTQRNETVHVVPDSLWNLDDYYKEIKFPDRNIVKKMTSIFDEEKYVAFQYGTEDRWEKVFHIVLDFCREQNYKLVAFAINSCHADRIVIEKIKEKYQNDCIIVDQMLQQTEIMNLISAAELFVGTSLHGALTAYLSGTYAVIYNMYSYFVSKMDGLVEWFDTQQFMVENEDQLKAVISDQLNREHFYEIIDRKLPKVKEKLKMHYDTMANAIIKVNTLDSVNLCMQQNVVIGRSYFQWENQNHNLKFKTVIQVAVDEYFDVVEEIEETYSDVVWCVPINNYAKIFVKATEMVPINVDNEGNCFERVAKYRILSRDGKIRFQYTINRNSSKELKMLVTLYHNKEAHIELLEEVERQLKAQEHTLQMENCEMQEKNTVLQNENISLQSQNVSLQEKNVSLQTKNSVLCEKNENLLEKNGNLIHELKNKEGHIEQLLEVEREYEREKHSRTYRMALGFRKISTFFFPVDSKRRFFARLIGKGMRHPILMLKMINVRRIKNCFTILRTEDAASALNHFRLVEEYEKSRDIPVENVDIVPVTENKKTIEEYEVLHFKQYEKPLVSIVIPVYNQFGYTYNCLKSILMNSGECSYEVIIANDCSTDLTTQLGDVAKGINIINNKDNLRFLLNCNNAAKYAKGEYLLFLNNDTQVQQDWLQPLVDLMEKDATTGMVGSKLIYADGYLQEAGGILWDDASAWNYGNRQNPNDSEFNFVHEVDYISGAAIMIRTKLWKEIGGFDERFVPAYCEDSDLAFEVRKHGYKVVYQPKSVVVHFEGISNGTDVTTGQKKYQVENQKKFYEKWKDELKQNHFPNGQDVFLARERGKGKKHILVIDHYVPQYDKDAGSKTTFMYLKMLVGKGYRITFLGDNFYQHEPYTTELQQMGIFVLYGPKYAEHWKEWLMENMQYFDIFYLNRPHITIKYIDFIKEHARGKIIYYGHDLHFLRIQREYELDGREEKLEESEKWKKQELYIMRQSNMNYYPSIVEEEAIHEIDSKIPVKAITAYVYEKFMNVTYEPEKREGILFVGGFGHAPNLDAVQWFLDKIYPDVYKNIKANFYIVGSKAPDEITHITTEGVIVKGFVSEEELKQLYNSCRLVVVPLRYGAGVKGKVVEALYYGIPVVTTSVGAEGIGGIENIAIVEDQEQKLVNAICEVYQNDDKLIEMSEKSQRYVREKFSTEAVWDIVKEDFE